MVILVFSAVQKFEWAIYFKIQKNDNTNDSVVRPKSGGVHSLQKAKQTAC